MLTLAIKMMLADRGKYLMLLSGITFSALLMTQQASVFCGLMMWTAGTLRNMNAPIWVVDPKVEEVNSVKNLRDMTLLRVRSVDGVGWALPVASQSLQVRLADGTFKVAQVIGLDASTLMGRPREMVSGRIEDLRLPHTVVLDEYGTTRFQMEGKPPLAVGDVFEINDHEARIVGICKTKRLFSGSPYVFTTYERCLEYAPKTRNMLSYVIAGPREGKTEEQVAQAIQRETGLNAYTKNEFFWSTVRWYIKNTGIPVSMGTTILLGMIVGIVISGQTFYSFVLEITPHLGALKAMGASQSLLARMLLLQALTVGLIGYTLGTGLACLFGFVVQGRGSPPFYLPSYLLLFTLTVILGICALSAFFGIWRISRLETAEVFRN
jgi:putative ABC transport system permease protein